MTAITDAVDTLFKEKGLPLVKTATEDGHFAYHGTFKLHAEDEPLSFNLLFQNEEDMSDFQIAFTKLAYVSFQQKEAVLEVLNEFNVYKGLYYTAVMGGDGEIFLKAISRVSKENVRPVYDMLVIGSNIAVTFAKELHTRF